MSQHLHIVFSQPPEGVSDDDFNRWYDAHLREILGVPGFLSARRFRLDPVVADPDVRYRYLAVYEIDGDPADAIAALAGAGMGSKDSYTALKDGGAGSLELPEWFARADLLLRDAALERRHDCLLGSHVRGRHLGDRAPVGPGVPAAVDGFRNAAAVLDELGVE